VQVFFNVKDKHGALVPGLVKDDFQILGNGKAQTVKYFSAESNQPLTLGILVDTSGSQERVLGNGKGNGSAVPQSHSARHRPGFLNQLRCQCELGQDFTNSKKLLKDALEKTKINTGGASCGGIAGIGGGPFRAVPAAPRHAAL